MSTSEKTQVEKWAYILVILWAGFQTLSTIVQGLQAWISVAHSIATKLSGNSSPTWSLYLVVLCSPALMIPILGWVALRVNRLTKKFESSPSEPAVPRTGPPIKIQVIEALGAIGKALIGGITNETARKPWRVITIFATLLFLGIISLPMPVSVAFPIGISLLLLAPFSFARLIVSLTRAEGTSLEQNVLFAIFSFALLTGFVTFQTNNINEIFSSWRLTVPQVQVQLPQVQLPELPKTIQSLFAVNNAADYIRVSIIIFASFFGLGGMLLSSESRITGLVSGALFGSIIGLGIGAVASGAWVFGNLLVHALPF